MLHMETQIEAWHPNLAGHRADDPQSPRPSSTSTSFDPRSQPQPPTHFMYRFTSSSFCWASLPDTTR